MKNKQQSFFDMQFITSCISTTMVLMLLGMVVFFVLSAGNLSVYVRENISFSALLSDDMKETEILKFQKTLDAQPYVKSTTYISKEQALREETEAMGTDPQEFIGYNPFTASIEINLNSVYANADSLAWVEKEIMKKGKVMEIVYPEALIDTVNRNVQKISIVLLGLAALLMVISFSLINNTIRLSVYARRFSIHTMKLVGASWGFIRAPFVRRYMLLGLLAAIIACIALGGAIYILYMYEPDILEVLTWQVLAITAGTVVFFGLFITALCSTISVNKFLKMKAGDLYKI